MLTYSVIVTAQSNHSSESETQAINTQFNRIVQETANLKQSYSETVQTLHAVTVLQDNLNVCIKNTQDRLKKISSILAALPPSTTSKSYDTLITQEKDLSTQLSDCLLFNYTIEDIRNTLNAHINTLNTIGFFKKTTPIWQSIHLSVLSNALKKHETFSERIGMDQLDTHHWIILLFLSLSGVMITYLLGTYCLSTLYKKQLNLWNLTLIGKTIRPDVSILLPLLLVILYLETLLCTTTLCPLIVLWLKVSFFYLLVLCIIKSASVLYVEGSPWPNRFMTVFQATVFIICILVGFNLTKSLGKEILFPLYLVDHQKVIYCIVFVRIILSLCQKRNHKLAAKPVYALAKRLNIFATGLFAAYITFTLLMTTFPEQNGFALFQTLFILLLNLGYLWIIWFVLGTHFLTGIAFNPYRKIALIVLSALFYALIVAAGLGYSYLGVSFVPHVIFTIVLIVIAKDVMAFINHMYFLLNDPSQAPSKKLRSAFESTSSKPIFELSFLRVIFTIVVMLVSVLCIMGIWQVGGLIESVFMLLKNGFPFLNTHLYLPKMIRAGNVFCIILIMGRVLSANITRKNRADKEYAEATIVINLLCRYLSFTLAILTALYIIGFELKSLLFLSSALTFGIGFALKNFVSDFMSGVIIIFNKPIKIGDYVILNHHGYYEGYIEKIGALSTQLRTLSDMNIIIPNSRVTSDFITNLTLQKNAFFRIKIVVILENMADAERAKELLLEVALNNSNVIRGLHKEPEVLFELNSMYLWCAIDNIENKQNIISELNLAIINAFKDKNIGIHFNKNSSHSSDMLPDTSFL